MRAVIKILNPCFKWISGVPFQVYKGAITNRSFDSMSAILIWMVNSIRKKYSNFDLKNKKVAEIGTGQFMAHPIGFKLLGASKVVTFDLYRQFNQKAAFISYSQQVMAKKFFSSLALPTDYMKVMSDIKLTKMALPELEKRGIEYWAPFDLLDYQDDDDFDLITSYTVLEHVPPREIEALMIKSIAVLKRGGIFCHYIDLEDHLDPESAPFAFLVEVDWSDQDCFSRGNRLRLSAWENIFEKLSGVDYEFVSVLRRETSLLPEGIMKKNELNEGDLAVSGILVVGKKH
jgi:SAM-dependent methyltransferase